MNKKDTKTINLKWAIPIEGKDGQIIKTKELELGRLKAKHFKFLPKDFMEKNGQIEPQQMIPLIAGLANIPVESADEIDMEDLPIIAEGLESFLSGYQETGKK